MALEIICAAADSDVQRFVPVTSLLFAPSSGPQNNTRYIAWLKGLVINNEENTFILLPLCIQGSHGSHWTLACLEWPSKTAACYDSNPSPSPTSRRNETMETHVRAFITSFLAIDDSDWQITLAACPHQRDESSPSCGISVIANATHLVLGRSLPAHAYHAGFWRSALACLAPGGTNEDGQALWPYTKTMDDHVAAASPSQSEISEVAVRTVVSTEAPVSRALTLLKEALAERRHVLGELRVLNALVETCRQAINPLGEDNKVLNGEMNTTAQRTVPGELSKYPTPQHILSQCPEMPGSDAGAVIVAAKIAEYEKAGSDTEKEKEKTRADGEKRWNRHRARMAQFIVVERLGARVDRAMMEALACVERLEEIQTKATKHVS
ncbi:hypothetical protein QBC39DRAFT_376905 [Podospora conica]|nr:hypothetical protein QBC39DRAFT_376905 [Schizothecium conicum]